MRNEVYVGVFAGLGKEKAKAQEVQAQEVQAKGWRAPRGQNQCRKPQAGKE